MVTSRAVVGSSAIRSSGSQRSAIAIITRWRKPPESWCGYWPRRLRGGGNADRFEQFGGAIAASRRTFGAAQRLHHLVADRVGGVERGHRVLEDHRHAVAAQFVSSRLGPSSSASVLAARRRRRARRTAPAADPCRERGQATCRDPIRRRCTASRRARAARLRRAPAWRMARGDGDRDLEPFDLEERVMSAVLSGAVRSRTPSPTRLMASTSGEQHGAGNGDEPGLKNM